jgi:Fic/DOC family N-terminal
MWRKLPTFPARVSQGSYSAFVPAPLPPELDVADWGTLGCGPARRKISGRRWSASQSHILIRPFVQREAVLSSKIGGTQATLGDLCAAEAGAIVGRSPEDLREVGNHVMAPDHGISRQGTRTSSRISKASPTGSGCTRQTTRNARVCRKCLHTVATICLGAIESFISL